MQINEWTDYVYQGRQYLKTARNGRKRKQVFTNEVTYNLIALSVEKLMLGLCMKFGHLPEDHTLSGIVTAAHDLCPMDPALKHEIHMMDQMLDMCALDGNMLCIVNDQQIDNLLLLNEQVHAFVASNIELPTHNATVGL